MDSVEVYLNKALEYDPNGFPALQMLSRLKANLDHDYATAEIYLERLVEVLSNGKFEPMLLPTELNYLAICEYQQKKYQEALEHVQLAIKLDTTSPYPYSTLAEIYALQGDKNQFYLTLEKAIDCGFPLSQFLNENPYNLFTHEPRFKKLLEKESAQSSR